MEKIQIPNRPPQHMKISELTEYSNTSSATIRYYIREGLLPEPIRTSLTMAYYTDEHLQGLRKINELKKRKLSLAAIKEKMSRHLLSDAHKQKAPSDIVYNSQRDKIVNTAVSLFRKKGYDTTSIDEVIKKAGIGKGTFYQHFKNKEFLFFECTDRVFYDIGTEVPQIREEKDVMQRLWKRALFFGRDHQHMIDMLNLARGASIKENGNFKKTLEAMMESLVSPIQKELEIAIAEKRLKLKDSMLTAYLLTGGTESLIYYHRDSNRKIDEIMRRAWDFSFHGAYAVDGSKNLPKAKSKTVEHSETPPGKSGSAKQGYEPPDKRGQIVSAAVRLFSRKGYAETSLADIARSAKMSKNIFYLYFKTKDELFMDCADKIFHDMYNHVWQKIREEPDMMKRLWKRIHAFIDSYPKWVVMMDLVRSLSVSENPVFKRKLFQLLKIMIHPIIGEIDKLIQQGRFRKDLDSTVSGYALAGMIDYGASLINRKVYSRKEITDYLDKILRHGLMGGRQTSTECQS